MEKTIYYFINYSKSMTAIGETNAPYMKDRGYTLVSKIVYDNYIKTNPKYLAKQKEMEERMNKIHLGE